MSNQEKLLALKGIAATVLAVLAQLLGGADAWLLTLIGFTLADYITGLCKGIITKTLASGTAFRGGLKKLLLYCIIGVAVALDRLLLPNTPLLRHLAVGYYIATEGLSILENIGACGVTFPKKVREVLQALKEQNERK